MTKLTTCLKTTTPSSSSTTDPTASDKSPSSLGDVDRSVLPDFPYPSIKDFVTMTMYKTDYPFEIAFQPQRMDDVPGRVAGQAER